MPDLFNQPHLEEGLKRYAPTRMEWLALQLNMDHIREHESDFMLSYFPFEDALGVHLNYRHNMAYNKVKRVIRFDVKSAISRKARIYGWDSWVKVHLKIWEGPNPNLDVESQLKEVLDSEPSEIYEWKGREEPKLIKSD